MSHFLRHGTFLALGCVTVWIIDQTLISYKSDSVIWQLQNGLWVKPE